MKLTPEDLIELIHIQNLYGHVLDRFLWDKLDEVFAPDGVFDPSNVGLPIMRGLDEIREKLIPLEEGPDGKNVHSHIGTNPAVIDVGEDGIVKMCCKYIVSAENDHISFGEYEDDCVKTDKGWRIKYRKTKRISANHAPFIPLDAAPRYDDD
jgi:SnoaL-like domain